MGKIYLLIEIGEYFPKSAGDRDRPIYLYLGDIPIERQTKLGKEIIEQLKLEQ